MSTNRIAIWYLLGEEYEDLPEELEGPLYTLYKPRNRQDFLELFSNTVPASGIFIHIFSHGSATGISPDRQRGSDFIEYTQINNCIKNHGLSNIYLNMMAVCHSAKANFDVKFFFCFDGENNDFRESLELHSLEGSYKERIQQLNARRIRYPSNKGYGDYHVFQNGKKLI